MSALLDALASIARAVLAVPAALLPRRYWDSLDALPLRQASVVSAAITAIAGGSVGARGLLSYLDRAADASVHSAFDFVARQARGEVPRTPDITTWDLQRLSIFSFAAFLLTPLGLFAIYLVLSGLVRAVSCCVDDPWGDPLLTGVDALMRRWIRRGRDGWATSARARAEGPAVADRLFTGAWAGLEGVDYVVVSSRRKPDWTRGTFVITADKWYTLGEPFDVQLPQGLRTVYPLTEQKVPEVLRRGVPYELPPLSRAARVGLGGRRPPSSLS